ncbi:MAG: REP-associated tyrosine transposase, partial [Thermoanaerobaculia bacterium]
MQDQIAYRRRLPHFQRADKTFIVTFVSHHRWILPDQARDIVLSEIVNLHRKKMFLLTTIVMPDHVHAVLQPLSDHKGLPHSLLRIFQRIKGRTSRFINQALSRKGAVWQDESHDHQIWNDESVMAKCEYVAQNAVRAGLVKRPEE